MPAVMERTITIDRLLAQRADRKLRQYGWSLDDAITRSLIAIVTVPGEPEKAFPSEIRKTMVRSSPLLRKLNALPRKYAKPDWDGYGADALNKESLVHARSFIRNLTDEYDSADVGIDADGEVTLEWYRSKDCHGSLTFSSTGHVYCIVRTNGERISATIPVAETNRILFLIHWDEGTRVNPSRSLLGAADLSGDSINATGLKVRLAPSGQLPHHAEIYAWPQGDTEDTKQQRIALATDLADASTYFPTSAPRQESHTQPRPHAN